LGAVALNWVLFKSLVTPLFDQLARTEEAAEKWRRQLMESPAASAPPEPMIIPSAELPDVAFLPNANELAGGESVDASQAQPEPIAPPVKTTLAKLVQSALRSLESEIQAGAISLNRIGLDEVEVEGDVLQLATAIEEVLKNAVESMRDTDKAQLTVTAHRHGDRLRFIVEDTGCGIPEEDLSKVFDPFYSTKDSQGVARGLGLNVVRRVIEEFSGTVELRRRNPGPGVAVEMEWPAGRTVAATAPEEDTAAAPTVPDDLDFILSADEDGDDEFSRVSVTSAREWPEVAIRKPKVRTLD
jgi:anti-sigma regulatory factor (Ser/Thr protein kinase)